MEAVITIISYLIGSIPTGFILGKAAGVDVRSVGSGNIGATNVARVMGKGHGLLTLIADVVKGLLPALVARQMAFSDAAVAVVGAAAFLGHLFPVFLKFRGGKGVATAFGVLLALAPQAMWVPLVAFIAAVVVSRRVSLGSICAAVAAPLALWFFSYPMPLTALAAFLAAFVIARHHANIKRLLAGSEPRFGEHAESQQT
jgi:glycerol-3-phosphate acyltransferase PlsY